MKKFAIPVVAAGAIFLPQAASAAAIAMSSLESGPVSVSFSNDVSNLSGELFSTASAAEGPTGVTTSDSNPLPGVADAPPATDGGMSADSIFTVSADEISFSSNAEGTVGPGDFGTAIGEVTGSFEFTNDIAGTVLEIVVELTRGFDLSTEFAGDVAAGATSFSLALLNSNILLPTVSLSNALCDPNASFSVSNGADFLSSCSTIATFTFADLAEGDYTLTFASSSSVDVVSDVPIPAAFGLFGLGAIGLGFVRRKKRTAA